MGIGIPLKVVKDGGKHAPGRKFHRDAVRGKQLLEWLFVKPAWMDGIVSLMLFNGFIIPDSVPELLSLWMHGCKHSVPWQWKTGFLCNLLHNRHRNPEEKPTPAKWYVSKLFFVYVLSIGSLQFQKSLTTILRHGNFILSCPPPLKNKKQKPTAARALAQTPKKVRDCLQVQTRWASSIQNCGRCGVTFQVW